ncbi:g10913 [Coccomyxa elongata]
MIRTGEGKPEGQHGNQAPLFVCCSGCQAVLKAGCKTCRVCGLLLRGASMGPLDKAESPSKVNQMADSSDEEDISSDSDSGSDAKVEGDGEAGDAERVKRGKDAGPSGRHLETYRAKVQPHERVDLPYFNCNTDKPMMEMVADSNVWYQAAILRETANEIRVLFPDPEEGDKVTKEWVKKSSSRIWRGSLSKHVWKYLSKGAWAPKKNPKPVRQRRSGSAPKQARRQRAQGDATDGTGTGASMDVDSAGDEGQATHRGDPQPARKQEHNMTESPDVVAAAQGAEEGGATHSNSGVLETGGFGFNNGVGLSSRDEAQAMEVEPEPPDPLTAWFRAHFMLLEERGTLVTQLDGAGPEVGVLPQHAPPPVRRFPPSAEPMRRKQRRRYDVNEGRCMDDADVKKEESVVGSDWQPARMGGNPTTGFGMDKSPPFKVYKEQPDEEDPAQQQAQNGLLEHNQGIAKGNGSSGARQEGKTGLITPEMSAAGSESEHRRHKRSGASHGSRDQARAGNHVSKQSAPKWSMGISDSYEDEEDAMSPTSSDSGRSPEPSKLVKASWKGSAASAGAPEPGKPRKHNLGKEKPGTQDRTAEQQGFRKASGTVKRADIHELGMQKPAANSAAQPKPRIAASHGAAAAGKHSVSAGPGRPAALRPDQLRSAVPQGSAIPQKRSPLGQPAPRKAAVWQGDSAASGPAHRVPATAASGPKSAAKQSGVTPAGNPSQLAATQLTKKLLPGSKDHRHFVGNSSNSSGADANTAAGPLMLQPTDCFED